MPEPEQQPSGIDLARQVLADYKKTTWAVPSKTPGRPKPKRRARLGDRRDPVSLGAALDALNVEMPLEAGTAGGSVIDQWPALCPQYAGLVQPVGYDAQRGRLDLRPGSHTYAAQLRLLGGQLAKQINDKMGRPVVRTIRVLPVGPIDTSSPAMPEPERADQHGPVKTRESAHPGYRAALEAVLANRPERQASNPYVAEAEARQVAAMRAHRQPETDHPDAVWAQAEAEQKAGPAPGSMEASERAARAYARRTAGGRDLPRAFDVA